MPAAHVITHDPTTEPAAGPTDPVDPSAATVAVPEIGAGWLRLSAALTDAVPDVADRDDLIVSIAPGAGHGAPACFMPATATIEVDGVHLGGVDPATVTPGRPSDRDRYPTAWGLLIHECAHAAHSRWAPPDGNITPPAAHKAATLLEESRIEAAHLDRRPGDRRWLRASATSLILADQPSDHATMTPWAAATAAALLLARVDAGVLDDDETAPVTRTVETVLGPERLAGLQEIWRAAHHVADDDTGGMLALGRRWCDLLGVDPDTTPPEPPTSPDGTASVKSPLAEAISSALAAVAATDAADSATAAPVPARDSTASTTERTAREAAKRAAGGVFSTDLSGPPAPGATAVTGTRPPTPAEHTAARGLARALNTAGRRDRVTTVTTSITPPGRLRMRGALAADAQRAAGQLPTAEPFTRTHRRVTPAPPLRVGIACDVSGSMRRYTRPVASAAWILARAADLTTTPATAATVIFGDTVRPITRPGHTPAAVTEFAALDSTERFTRAVDALDHAIGLTQAGAARLLVIVSDGHFTDTEHTNGKQRIARLTAAGCAVLWLTPCDHPAPFPGVHTLTLTDPATTADAIGQAATAALRQS